MGLAEARAEIERHREVVVAVACKAHIRRLRKLDGRRLDELEDYLMRAFAERQGWLAAENGDSLT